MVNLAGELIHIWHATCKLAFFGPACFAARSIAHLGAARASLCSQAQNTFDEPP
jgi:hypothetical protein